MPGPPTHDPAERWARLQAIFHAAAELPEADRPAFLDARCAGDEALRRDVIALLAEDDRGGSILDKGVARVAHDVMGDADPAAIPRQSFGPYQIQGILGEGGMGVVYRARRSDLGNEVAIKILRDASLSPARRERFASEQRTLAQLNHPAIARLYDADTLADGTPWFAMELVEGVPLIDYARTHAPSVPERLRLFRAVCEAVQHAHSHAVIHRDLKPSNILVRPDGAVKLLDFGIAKQIESLDSTRDQTMTGMRMMTPAYAAPEQLRGDRLGVHTDVYALGVLLYQLLTGRLPFDLERRTPAEAERLVLDQDPDRPSAVVRRGGEGSPFAPRPLPTDRGEWADLDVLCLTAMHKDPARRYRTVDAMVRDLDRFLKSEPLEAQPDSWRYRSSKFLKRNWRPVSVAAAVLGVLAALVVFYTVRLTIARNAALAETARTQRIQQFMLNLFQGGDEDAGPADTLRVVTMVEHGIEEARNLDNEPVVQAELYQTLGDISRQLGQFDRADSLLRVALARRRSQVGAEHRDVAKSLLALGLLRAEQARYEEADSLVRMGLAMAKRTAPARDPLVAEATSALGVVLELRGDYDQAMPVLREAIRLQSLSGSNDAAVAYNYAHLANVTFYAGDYDAADSLNHLVLEMNRKRLGERHPSVAQDLINIGAVQFEVGRYAEAERYFRQALDIHQSWYGPDHQETASTLTMLARAVLYQDRYDEARALLDRALAVMERVYGPVHPRVASALNELGNVALKQGRLGDAEAAYRRMVDIYRVVHNDEHPVIGIGLSNLAGIFVERKEYAKAEALYRDVLGRYAASGLPDDHMNVGITRIKLGRALLRSKRYEEAAAESQAGYDILIKQADPGVSFLRAARTDLAVAYDALGQPERAAKLRAEQEQVAAAAAR
jgi:serine/threonine-protein kinase